MLNDRDTYDICWALAIHIWENNKNLKEPVPSDSNHKAGLRKLYAWYKKAKERLPRKKIFDGSIESLGKYLEQVNNG